MSRVLVVGGGITGLSFCHRLQQATNVKTTLIESSSRLGGWIQSDRDQSGVLSERGPRSLTTRKGEETVKLIEELELDEHVIIANPDAANRYIWKDGSAHLVPSSILGYLRSNLTRSSVWGLMAEPFRKTSLADDEAVYDFASRRVNEDFAKYLIDPVIAGVYAGDPKRLSVRSCFPPIFDMERKHGSLTKALLRGLREKQPPASDLFKHLQAHGGIYSFQDGIETLPRALANAIPCTKVLTNTTLNSFSTSIEGVIRVRLNKEGTEVEEEYDSIVSTINAVDLSAVLSRSSCSDPQTLGQVAQKLAQIDHASLYTVNIAYDQPVTLAPGFGLLFPTCEGLEILGIVYNSHCFPSQSPETRLTVMLGGARHPHIAQISPQEAEQRALSFIQKCLKITATPSYVSTNLATNCIPQYYVGHRAAMASVSDLVQACLGTKLTILGTSTNGVSVNDCISAGRRHAASLVQT